MKKNIIKATLVAVITLVAGYNVYSSQKLEGMSDLALANVEALADGEWNNWNEWLSQGFTKDEREWERPCPSTETSTGQGNISSGGSSVGGGGSHSQTNPSGRREITCPYGNTNCTSIGC